MYKSGQKVVFVGLNPNSNVNVKENVNIPKLFEVVTIESKADWTDDHWIVKEYPLNIFGITQAFDATEIKPLKKMLDLHQKEAFSIVKPDILEYQLN